MSKGNINTEQIVAYLNARQQQLAHELEKVEQALAAVSVLNDSNGSKALKHLFKAEKLIRKADKAIAAKEKAKAKKVAAAAEKKIAKDLKKATTAAKKVEVTAKKVTPAKTLSASPLNSAPAKPVRRSNRPSAPKPVVVAETDPAKASNIDAVTSSGK